MKKILGLALILNLLIVSLAMAWNPPDGWDSWKQAMATFGFSAPNSSKITLNRSLQITSGQLLLPDGSTDVPSIAFINAPGTGLYSDDPQGAIKFTVSKSLRGMINPYHLVLYTVYGISLNDTTFLINDAANTLALKNGNNDQTQRWYGANGAYFQVKTQSELLTIAAAANTPTTMTVPIYATVQGVAVFVETAIPTAATFTVTLTTQGTTLNNAAVSTAQGSTDLGNNNCPVKSTSAQTITITPNLSPEAATGKVRIVLMYTVPSPPTS